MEDIMEEAQLSKRERAAKLIRWLLAKTVENGCTESEAMNAAAKANELMTQYALSIEDTQEVKDEVYAQADWQSAAAEPA
jgi:hypothetical protein